MIHVIAGPDLHQLNGLAENVLPGAGVFGMLIESRTHITDEVPSQSGQLHFFRRPFDQSVALQLRQLYKCASFQ